MNEREKALLVAAKYNHDYETVDVTCELCNELADLILAQRRAAKIEALEWAKIQCKLGLDSYIVFERIRAEIDSLKGEQCQK